MDFWHENQGQSPLYSRFGTVPGRNCANNYNDRHQGTYHPLYYSVQPDQGRASSHWTAPVSRTGGGPHDYTNWTDQDLTSLTSSQFPFVLDHHPQQHQELGEYQLHEARGREWAAAQRATREYDRGYSREGWQRRWELCSPVRHNREVSTKRSDNSYRELEAWAARYSHSLPRRKRIEAELRGASQGFLDSRDSSSSSSRSTTDPRVAALQQVMQSSNIRESWDRGGRPKGLTHYLSQTPSRETSLMLDMKEKLSCQRRMFSQPPGYIAPPPYTSPHKGLSLLHQCDTSLEKDGKRQSYWSQPTPQKQDVLVDLLSQRKAEKEDFKLTDGNLKTYLELDGLKQRQQETDALQAHSPESTADTESEVTVPQQQPQLIQKVQEKRINEDSLLKVIEGRKFRLNKNTGGMTIFCLVSRIAGTSETPSLPLCTSQRYSPNTDSGEGTKEDSDDKLFDEVDFRALPLREQLDMSESQSLHANPKETSICAEQKMLEENLSKNSETRLVDTNYGEPSPGRQSLQPATVKYPLWREPSLASRAEGDKPSSGSKASTKDATSDVSTEEDSGTVLPIDIEVRRLDITKATESDDSNDLLVIDTTCVLVKMELIPSPKKEHVHYLHSAPNTEDSTADIPSTDSSEVVQSNSPVNQEATTDCSAQTNPWKLSEDLEIQLDTDCQGKLEPEVEAKISFPYMSSLVSERETLEERAERILGIPLQECIPDQQPEAALLCFDLHSENQVVDPSPTQDNKSCEADRRIEDNTQDKEELQNQTKVSETEHVDDDDDDDAKDQEDVRSDQDFAVSQNQVPDTFEENDVVSPLKTDFKSSFENVTVENSVLGSIQEDGTAEQNHDENQPVEKDTLPHQSKSTVFNAADNQVSSPEVSSLSVSPSQQLSPSLPPTTLTQSLTLHLDQSLSPHSFDSLKQTAGALSSVAEDEDEMVATLQQTHEQLCDNQGSDITDGSEGCYKRDNTSSLQEIDANDDQPTEHAVIDPVSDIKAEAKEFNFCQEQHEGVQAEDITCIKEGYLTAEQPPKEANEDLTDLIKEETFKEIKEYAMQVNSLQQTECVQTDHVAWAKDSYMAEEQQIQEATEDLTPLLQKTITTDVTTDSQTHPETKIVQDIEPVSDTLHSSPPSPHLDVCPLHLDALSPLELTSLPDSSNKPSEELARLLEMDSVCPFALSPSVDVAPAEGISEMFPLPLQPDSCEDYLQLPSFPSLPPVMPASSSSSLPLEGSESCSPDFILKEEPQYPRSLWDVVNRIRKHTAPDSENEEEEVSELWDPESMGEDRTEITRAETTVFDETRPKVSAGGSVDDAEEGQTKQCPETCGQAEDDTLSCSSTSSHSSEDTVTEADEEEKMEMEELQHDAGTEINQQNYVAFQKAEEE